MPTPWFDNVPAAVEIDVRHLASVLRFHGQGEVSYARAMRRLVRLVTLGGEKELQQLVQRRADAEQKAKEDAEGDDEWFD